MFRKILVPVDLTPKNRIAVTTACELAEHHRGRIILLHIIERVQHISQQELKGFYHKLKKSAEAKMRVLKRQLEGQGVSVSYAIFVGNRTESIVRYASSKKVDLILLNSHRIDLSKKGSDWGTISYKVALLSPCPVLLVK